MRFNELADWYIENHRKPDGSALRGAAKRNLKTDVGHLKDVFGDRLLTDITPEVISKWYFGPHDEGAWVFPRMCQRLNAILSIACSDSFGGDMPLLESNPFTLPMPPDPEPKSWDVPPLTPTQLRGLYENMPEYTRLSVLLAVWAGGMRIGEVCALRVEDLDLDMRLMRVEHSVCRDENDLGSVILGPVKSKHSRRVCVLPEVLIPLIRSHVEKYCDPSDPMLFQARRGKMLCRNTLATQFRNARVKAGCPQATFRTLRVTHTTQLLQYGGTVREAMDSIGDSTQEVVMRHYTRTIPEHQKDVVNKMADSMAAKDDSLMRLLGIVSEGRTEELAFVGDATSLQEIMSRFQELFSMIGSLVPSA